MTQNGSDSESDGEDESDDDNGNQVNEEDNLGPKLDLIELENVPEAKEMLFHKEDF